MLLGGVSIAMSANVAETTLLPRPPKGREHVPVQLPRLLHAHQILLNEPRDGPEGNVSRTSEMQVWFVTEHLDGGPLVDTDGQAAD